MLAKSLESVKIEQSNATLYRITVQFLSSQATTNYKWTLVVFRTIL